MNKFLNIGLCAAILLASVGLTGIVVNAEEQRVRILDAPQNLTQRDWQYLQYRVTELERKVRGMQKQITILHAKKADR